MTTDALSPVITALTQRAAGGDLKARRALLELVVPVIQRSVRRVMGSDDCEREDATQRACVAFVEGLSTFRYECHPDGFACRIAVHVALSYRRRARAELGRLQTLAVHAFPRSSLDSGEVLSAERRNRLLRALLDELPDPQAETLALHIMLGFSLKEISEATATPLNTVKSRLRLAKRALRSRIEADSALAEELGVGT